MVENLHSYYVFHWVLFLVSAGYLSKPAVDIYSELSDNRHNQNDRETQMTQFFPRKDTVEASSDKHGGEIDVDRYGDGMVLISIRDRNGLNVSQFRFEDQAGFDEWLRHLADQCQG